MEDSNINVYDFIDKIASLLSRNNIHNYDNIIFQFVKKNKKTIKYRITMEKDNNKYAKTYIKRLIPYKRKKEINENSLSNLRYKNNNFKNKDINFKNDNLRNSIELFEGKMSKLMKDKSDNIFKHNENLHTENNIYIEKENNIINNKTSNDVDKNTDNECVDIEEKNIESCNKCYLYKDFIKGINDDYIGKINNVCNLNCFFNDNIKSIIDIEKEQYNIFYNKINTLNNIYPNKKILDCINIYNDFRKDFHDKINVLFKESNISILSEYEYIKKYNEDILIEID